MPGPWEHTTAALADKFRDTGYPYFYSARRVRRPYLYRNTVVGRVLAGNLLFPFNLTRSMMVRFAGQPAGDYLNMTPYQTGVPPLNEQIFHDASLRNFKQSQSSDASQSKRVSPENLRSQIKIWLYDDWATKVAGGKPYVHLSFIPKSLDFNVAAQAKSIGIVGRNYPNYHYSGAEETLTLEIDWYDFTDLENESIVVKCRKLDALTKADGYSSGLKYIYIEWGDYNHWRQGEKQLFTRQVYMVQSAEYKFTDFAFKRRIAYTGSSSDGPITTMNGLFPQHASQKLILKKIAGQLTHQKIIHP